jgi:hypothetical protein
LYNLRWVIKLMLGSMGVGITPSKTMGAHYGSYVAIELLLWFIGHGNVLVSLQHNE